MTAISVPLDNHLESGNTEAWKLLERRMKLPQRHRLLHGYPLYAGLRAAGELTPVRRRFMDKSRVVLPELKRGLLVGVLPHPFCNPSVRGCGYCTFPHQPYRRSAALAQVSSVIREIRQHARVNPEIGDVPVQGLYFGGGTANLTPVESLRRLARTLNTALDLGLAEVTLEGVPAYFIKRDRPMDCLLETLDAARFRISMGIQSFDTAQLERMGRTAFGDADTFASVVKEARARDIAVSGDLLFNLPGQSIDAMRDDLRRALNLGLDQVCLYHLVLARGLGTEWSRDRDLLARLPDNEQSCDNWLVLRNDLLEAGYVQTTLTNFERGDVNDSDLSYRYENASFEPDRYDMLGFGPSGISFSANRAFTSGFKLVNPAQAEEYSSALHGDDACWDRYYEYDATALEIFYLTRRLAALSIDPERYRALFGAPVWLDFGEALEALAHTGLLEPRRDRLVPTPKGMFYADSMASLFSEIGKRAAASASNFEGSM